MLPDFYLRNKPAFIVLIYLSVIFIILMIAGLYYLNSHNFKNNNTLNQAEKKIVKPVISDEEQRLRSVNDFINNPGEEEKNMTPQQKEARKQEIIKFLNKK